MSSEYTRKRGTQTYSGEKETDQELSTHFPTFALAQCEKPSKNLFGFILFFTIMSDRPVKKTKEYRFKKNEEQKSKRRVIVVLEHACLETVKSKKGNYELLNCDDHMSLLKKMNRDWTEVRPDITHQVRCS